jgi:uncharacterized protein YkwD
MRPILLTAIQSSLFLAALLVPIASSLGQEAKSKRSSEAPPGPEPSDATLEALLEAHNRVRAEEKLPPLKANAQLTQAARLHARDIAERNQLSHEGSDGSDPAMRVKRAGYVFKEVAENVAAGQDTVADAMRSWIESPPHRKNILGDFTEMGGAVAKASDGQSYWCVDFGRPMPKVEASRSPAEMIAALNRARADAKKPPLKADAQLSRIAGRFAREAATRKALDGKDSDGKTPFDVLKSEGFPGRRFAMTLASGEGDPGKVLASWLERDEDRETLLSKFDRAGVGVATDSEGIPYWVILLSQSEGR